MRKLRSFAYILAKKSGCHNSFEIENSGLWLTDLWHLHCHWAGRLLGRHVPPPSSSRAPSLFLDEGSDAAGVCSSVLPAHPPHPQPVFSGSRPLERRLPPLPLRSAGGRVGDHHPATLHGDDLAAVCQPGHFQGEGGQVVGRDGAEEGQRVTGGEEQSRGGGRGGGWSLHAEGLTLRGRRQRQHQSHHPNVCKG